ncbi:protein of unknown function [Kingella kingae]|nr:protein of unknown function [Kingella kingae]
MDSKAGRWFAEYMLYDDETAYAAIAYSIKKQAQRTPRLKQVLQEISQERVH